MQADADITLRAVETQDLVRMKLTRFLPCCGQRRLIKRLGRDWFDAMVTCAAHSVMQTSTGAAHALLTVATGVRGFLLLVLLAHLAQHRSAARSVFSVVHVQVEIGLGSTGCACCSIDSSNKNKSRRNRCLSESICNRVIPLFRILE